MHKELQKQLNECKVIWENFISVLGGGRDIPKSKQRFCKSLQQYLRADESVLIKHIIKGHVADPNEIKRVEANKWSDLSIGERDDTKCIMNKNRDDFEQYLARIFTSLLTLGTKQPEISKDKKFREDYFVADIPMDYDYKKKNGIKKQVESATDETRKEELQDLDYMYNSDTKIQVAFKKTKEGEWRIDSIYPVSKSFGDVEQMKARIEYLKNRRGLTEGVS